MIITTVKVSGTPDKLAFTQQPTNSTGGVAFPQQPQVTVQDASGNPVVGATNSITLAIGTNPSSGTLTCTTNPLAASAATGVATFAGCKIDKAGTGYTLAASATGLTGATSATFNVTVGAAASFTLAAATTTPVAGAANNLTITAVDAGGNLVTTYTGDKTLVFTGAANAPAGTVPTVSDKTGAPKNFGVNTTITFASGQATVTGSNNGVMKLYKAESATITVTQGGLTGQLAVTVAAAAASTFGLVNCTIAGGATPCDGTYDQNSSDTFTANINVLDAYGNTPAATTVTITLSLTGTGSVFSFASLSPSTSTTTTITAGTQSGVISVYKRTNSNVTETVTLSATGYTSLLFTVKK